MQKQKAPIYQGTLNTQEKSAATHSLLTIHSSVIITFTYINLSIDIH